jgi:hypothetical protein
LSKEHPCKYIFVIILVDIVSNLNHNPPVIILNAMVMILQFLTTLFIAFTFVAYADECDRFQIRPEASISLGTTSYQSLDTCRLRYVDEFPLPDPNCTPGAVNPTISINTLRDPFFRTRCLRNQASTHKEKFIAYTRYAQSHPEHNFGPTQTCELDHLVPLELGGADTLDNIYPQCGPLGAPLEARFFKRKDTVENYLAWAVKTGRMNLIDAQKGIASNWIQYLKIAESTCPDGRCPFSK